jgi:DNA-binding MarR family transcriptional regulator
MVPMPAQATTSELAHELRESIGRLLRRLRAEPGELPVGQIAVLSRLDREGPASISDLAAADRMRPQSMAQTVHDLESAGLVARRPDPADRRRSFVELTPLGLQTLNAMRAHREDWLTQVLDRELDAEQRELLRRAVELLGRVADA